MKTKKDRKKRKSKISLKWRLFAYFSIFTVILLAILWICQTLLLDSIYRQIKTDSLKKCVNEIAYSIKNEDYKDRIDELARSYDVNIKVVSSDYDTVYEYVVSPTNVVTRISELDVYMLCEKAIENGGSYTEPFQQFIVGVRDERRAQNGTDTHSSRPQMPNRGESRPQGQGFTRGEHPIFANSNVLLNLISTRVASFKGGERCYIIVDSLITPVNATVKTLAVLLMYISVFTVLFAMVLAFLLARRISNPIIKMNKNADRLAKGDYGVTFDSRGYAEIEQLNDTMNYAAKELSRADQLRHELIANVSHDLRTPLTMIIGYSEVMRDIPGESSPENIQVVIDEATRLSSLVNDLLDISRLQSGTMQLNPEEYNITDSLHGIISRFDKFRDNCEITLDAEDDVYVTADENRISQVIYNLITNAINYSGNDKRVYVKQTLVGSTLRIEVSDNGEGIAKEDLPYIWDRYYRVDKTHKRAGIGTGLGLSIVKTVLESHGAVYGVESTLGVGSTFWFELGNAERAQEKE
ncbi:MAG: HAMP domain-containing histidine kinase [Clostridia bacterium]|nr:HAMP domain-containing histidine kinase [Clostridia bacterium]